MMKAIIKSSQSVADLTLGAVTGVGKQWSAVIADARTHDAVSTEEAADETAPVAGRTRCPPDWTWPPSPMVSGRARKQ